MKKKIAENLNRIKGEVAEACSRSRRNPSSVRIIAVTKTVEVDTIRALLELGHFHIGESRVQELIQRNAMIQESISRRKELAEEPPATPVVRPSWHMIGHLQRNKVKQLLPIVDFIHSVDSLRLAEEINTNAAKLGLVKKVRIFLQVNTSNEKQKYGLAVGAVGALAEQIRTLPNLEMVGLMTMAPLTEDREMSRFCFARCREIFEELRGEKICGPAFNHLSMGMSQDYVTAVEEGATMVRIGTALFE
ncbi:MAG: YggS family pyridoxal phosphate-dependent enzyme [Sedimentisphaerales bacterium]|nr:YggS family pyridoxal phosphate-dependent enzyme [Sedimentisphaerales bacterium]